MSASIEEPPDPPEIIAIGGSAGSVRFLLSLAPNLPTQLDIPVLVVIHRMRNEISMLHSILENRLGVPAKEAEDKEPLAPGVIYVAPPDYHLLLEDDRSFALADMELVNYSRPSIDVTFASVADVFQANAAGILLSGANEDGSAGLAQIAAKGGRAIAHCTAEAEVPTMPQAAINSIDACEIMDRKQLSTFLQAACSACQPPPRPAPSTVE